MSMLAERKQKQRWSLNPRGKHWSEDVNKFGHKMLEKMGWSAGKGLGANEDGITEHVKVSYKNDAKGMGFEDNGEQWTQHEDNFTSLLANLGAGQEATQITLPKPEKSLEKKSQETRSRVHYKKFTRGKDLASRSEKDIANIFGRKTLERPVEQKNETQEESANGTEDKSFGVVTVKAGNMADYFKSKLGKLGNFGSSKGDYDLNGHDDYESGIGACTGFGFSSVSEKPEEKTNATNKMNFVSAQNETTSKKRKRNDSEDTPTTTPEVTTSKKKKKNKKNHQMAFDNPGNDINPAEEVCYDNPGLNPNDSLQEMDEKARKKKRVTFSSPITEVLNKSDESEKKEKNKKKKKKNKNAENGIDNLGCEDNSFEESTVHQMTNDENEKKTKKKKKRDLSLDSTTDDGTPSKKKKKHEQVGIDNLACEEISINEKNEEIKRYKLKKKAMEHGLVNPACVAIDDSVEEQNDCPKKKKNKSKESLNNSECDEHSILEDIEVPRKKGKKQKNKNDDSLNGSTISIDSQNNDEIKTKKNKKNKKSTEENITETTSPKKLKKKSKSLENGIENLACEINTVEENIASINSEIDNYQNELENELNVKKVKKQKKGKNSPKEETSEEIQNQNQNQNSPNKKSKKKTFPRNKQKSNGDSNFQKKSEFKGKPGQQTGPQNRRQNLNHPNQIAPNTRRQNFNQGHQTAPNRRQNFNQGNQAAPNGRRQNFDRNNRFNNAQGGPNNFNNQSFNNGQRGPNNFNNQSFNNGQRGFNNWQGGQNNFKVDKSGLKNILKPGELKLNFSGSNLLKLAGYGVNHELVNKPLRPEAKSETSLKSL